MKQFEKVLTPLTRYTDRLLSKRDEESLKKRLESAENSPLELYNHAISTLIHFSKIDFENFETDKVKPLSFDTTKSLIEQIKEYNRLMLEEFSKCIARLEKNESDYKERSDFIGLTIMHTSTHFGQALRIQKININESKITVGNING